MDLLNLVNGRWTEGSGPEFADTNPARPDEVVARGRAASAEEVRAAVGAARDAAPAWRATPHHERAAVLGRAADLIDRSAEEWGRELSREEGKTLAEGVAEVRGAARILRYYAAEADRESGEVYASPRPGENLLVLRRPVGVAGLITVGDPLAAGVEMGPLVSAAARDRVSAGVRRAVEEGAEPLAGARPYEEGDLAAGWFAPPTVLALPGTDVDVWSTELFGPVVGAVRASGPEEALRLANRSEHGLSAAIFTRDLGAALRAVDDLDVGVLHVNSESAGTFPWVPFGGRKLSGFGPREQGRAAREFFTQTVTVYLGAPA